MRLVLLSVFAVSTVALAQPRGGPPQESITACSGLNEGTACGFTHDGNNLTGTCRNGPNGEAAACRPEGGPGGGRHRGPPQEAVTACSGKSASATCSFTHHDRTVEGTCRTGPESESLACAPAHRGPPQEALAACASSSAGAACTISIHGKSLSGTCATGPDNSTLACRPARPPQR
ncbi:MAG: hypothetical protein ACO1OB_25575 [Archangium sp.]